jgi:allantoicase
VIVRLAHEGFIDGLSIDTHHFKGNYPDSCLVEGINMPFENEHLLSSAELTWITILPQSKLKPDEKHFFKKEIVNQGPFTHVRLSIFPDGGISRMRVWGRIKK